MSESSNQEPVEASAESNGVRVQHLSFKTDAATIAKMTELQRAWEDARRQQQLDQIHAGRRIRREQYERALQPVVVLYPEPTGDPIQDAYNRRHAELEAQDQRQVNAGRVWRYDHGYSI